jgi:N-methylhydantoinase B
MAGGGAGSVGRLCVKREDGKRLNLPAMMEKVNLSAGERVVVMGGTGGYGDPLDRAPGAVARDVADGYLDEDAAARDYGVILSAGRIDEEASRALRLSRRRADLH